MKKWKAIAKNGSKAQVWNDGDFWRWSAQFGDGSGFRTDQCSSRRRAVEEAKVTLSGMTDQRPLPRFRRLEDPWEA